MENSENKKVEIFTSPRHKGTVIIKKERSFAQIQEQRKFESIKTWSTRLLEAQLRSERVSAEFKAACEAELKLRKK